MTYPVAYITNLIQKTAVSDSVFPYNAGEFIKVMSWEPHKIRFRDFERI